MAHLSSPYGTEFYGKSAVRAMHTEFAALLTRTGVSQARIARLSGLTPCKVAPAPFLLSDGRDSL